MIGPSGGGKSSLARALVGVWSPAHGSVRLDGATLDQYPKADLGRSIGYLPQTVELLDGTIGQSISRFSTDPDPEAIVEAAEAAGAHAMITGFPDGYDTQVGQDGAALSAGQRQRVALARALYGSPFLIVLDEPNANLDSDGERALLKAMNDARARGAIVVLVAHRLVSREIMDYLAVVEGGTVSKFGPREEVMRQMLDGRKDLKVVQPAGGQRDG